MGAVAASLCRGAWSWLCSHCDRAPWLQSFAEAEICQIGRLLSACHTVAFAKTGWALNILKVVTIRPATERDRNAVWEIFHEVVSAGDTYALDPQMSRHDALTYWFGSNTHTYVAENDKQIVGTYILRPNQTGAGAHVANAAFMVPARARGERIGRAMAEHSLDEARRRGFRAMQFNFVV